MFSNVIMYLNLYEMKKSNFVLFVMLIVMIISVFCSCSEKKTTPFKLNVSVKDSTTFRAKNYYSYSSGLTITSMFTKLIKLPIGYLPGDTISIGTEMFILGRMVSKSNDSL